MKDKIKYKLSSMWIILTCSLVITLILGYLGIWLSNLLLIFASMISFFFIVLISIVYPILKSEVQWKYKVIVLLCLFVVLYMGYTKVRYTEIIPTIYFIFQPEDYYEPLISDEFVFYQKGYSKTYLLPYKYPGVHAIKLVRGNNDLSKTNGLTGKLKAEFFYKEQLLFEEVSTGIDPCLTNRVIYLLEFFMPLNNRYKKDISVRITVLEPYMELEQFGRLYIEIGITSF